MSRRNHVPIEQHTNRRFLDPSIATDTDRDGGESHVIDQSDSTLGIPIASPDLTIAIPTFRRPDRLKRAIESVLRQKSDRQIEVIVVDNDPIASQHIESMIRGFSASNLIYYRNAINLGMTGNWNRCIELAKAQVVMMLHDDDYLAPDALRHAFEFLDSNREPFAMFLANRTFPNKGSISATKRRVSQIASMLPSALRPAVVTMTKWHLYSLVFPGHLAPSCGSLLNKAVLMANGGFRGDTVPDLVTAIRNLQNGILFGTVNDRSWGVVGTSVSASTSGVTRALAAREVFQVHSEYLGQIRSRYPVLHLDLFSRPKVVAGFLKCYWRPRDAFESRVFAASLDRMIFGADAGLLSTVRYQVTRLASYIAHSLGLFLFSGSDVRSSHGRWNSRLVCSTLVRLKRRPLR